MKEWFSKALGIDNEVKCLKNEAESVFRLAERLEGGLESGLKSDIAFKCFKYYEMLQSRIYELLTVKIKIYDVISQLNDRDIRQVLILRYLSFFTWSQIADEMDLELRQVYRLHEKALKEAEIYI